MEAGNCSGLQRFLKRCTLYRLKRQAYLEIYSVAFQRASNYIGNI